MTETSTTLTTTTAGSEGAEAPPIVVEIPAPAGNPVMERFWMAVRRLPRYVFLGSTLVRDDRVPARIKAMLVAGGAYAISPIDLVPGIIPVAGQLDDLVVVLMALRTAIRACPPEVSAEHLTRAGLTEADFDNDLRAVRDTAVWLARKGLRATGRLAVRGGRRLKSLFGQR